MNDDWRALALLVAGMIGTPALIGFGLQRLKRKRVIENIPTSKIRSASMGSIELKGQAFPVAEIKAPLTQTPCCWWEYRIEEERKDSKGRRSWKEIADICSAQPLFLKDETGQVLVDPADAEIHASERIFDCSHQGALIREMGVSNARGKRDHQPGAGILGQLFSGFMGKRMRAHEVLITQGSPLYVLGELGNNELYQAEKKQNFQDFIRQAKLDPKQMALADTNQDGRVDSEEWDAFRGLLEAEFLKQQQVQGKNQNRFIVKMPAAKEIPFIVGTQGEDSIKGKLGWQAFGLILAGLVGNGVVTAFVLPQMVPGPVERLAIFWAVAAVLGLAFGQFVKTGHSRKRRGQKS